MISAFKMKVRMKFRITFKTQDFRGVFKNDIEGYFKGSSRGCLSIKGDLKGTGQLRSRSGLVQVLELQLRAPIF